jgi:hypothetical protein
VFGKLPDNGGPRLFGRLDVEQARPLAKEVAGRLSTETRTLSQRSLAWLLAPLATRLDPADAKELCGGIAERLGAQLVSATGETDAMFLAEGFSALVAWLGPDEAATLARKLTQRIAIEQNPSNLGPLVRAIGALTESLGDEQLVALMRLHYPYKNVRQAVLRELNRRNGRVRALAVAVGPTAVVAGSAHPFKDVWEFAEWAKKHRPDLEFKSRHGLPAPK